MSLRLRQALMLLLACGLALQGLAASLPCHHARAALVQTQDEAVHHAHHHEMAQSQETAPHDMAGCLGNCDCPGHCGLSLALLPPPPILGEDARPAPLRLTRWSPPLQLAHDRSPLRPPITA